MTQNDQNSNTGSCCTDTEQPEHHIAEGTIKEFDIAEGAVKFDGKLINKGTIVFRSSDESLAVPELYAAEIINDGTIITESPELAINTTIFRGEGTVIASKRITVKTTEKNLAILGNTFRSEELELLCDGILQARPHEVEGRIDYTACAAMVGVQAGNLHIGRQTLGGDPIYYNRGGDVTISSPPTDGSDVFAMAHGNITCGSIDTSQGDETTYGRIDFVTGVEFDDPGPDTTSVVACTNCLPALSDPALATTGQSDTGTITVTGNLKGKSITMRADIISITGNIEAVTGNPLGSGGSVNLTGFSSVDVAGTIVALDDEENIGGVFISSPQISLSSKVTASHIEMQTVFEEEASVLTGSVVTADLEGRDTVYINAGGILLSCGGGSFQSAGVSQGVFSIETGDITSEGTVGLYATSSITTGAVLLNENDSGNFAGHDLRIYAHVDNESPATMNIGSGGISSITVHGTVDNPANKTGVILLSNGSGDITLNGDAITVSNEQDGTPSLLVSAGDGTLTLTGSGLDFDGTSTAPAGSVILHGAEIVVSGAFAISANSTVEAPEEFPPQVAIVTDLLTLSGDLSIECNGNTQTSISFAPKDGLNIDPTQMVCQPLRLGYMIPNTADADFVVSGAGDLEATANSQSGFVNVGGTYVEFDAGTVDLTSLGEFTGVNFNYGGSPSGVDSLAFLGGKVTVTVNNPEAEGGNITINTDQITIETEVELNADSVGGERGGYVTITTSGGGINGNESGSLAITANGEASGQGGDVTLNSAAGIMVDINVAANGGESGDGGIITVGFSSEDELNVTNLSATGGSETGGSITITNNAAADLTVNVTGVIDTNAAASEDEFSGSITLAVSDAETSAISLFIAEGGGFNSLLTAEGSTVTVDADAVVNLGLGEITANVGNVNITADASCTTCFNAAGRLVAAANAIIGITNTINAPNGSIELVGGDVYSIDSPSDLTLALPGNGQPVTISCFKFEFGQNTYFNGNTFSGKITLQSRETDEFTIVLPVFSKAGIKSAKEIYIGSAGGAPELQPVHIIVDGGLSNFVLECAGSPGKATIFANGSLNITASLGSPSGGVANSAESPDFLEIASDSGDIDLYPAGGNAWANKTIQVNAVATGRDVNARNLRAGSTTNAGDIEIEAGRDVLVAGSVLAQGVINCIAGRNLSVGASMQALTNASYPAGIALQADGNIYIEQNASIDAYGDISVFTTNPITQSNPYPGSVPSGVTSGQVSVASGGAIYWGNSSRLILPDPTTPTFTASGSELTFDAASGTTINIDQNASFNAHT